MHESFCIKTLDRRGAPLRILRTDAALTRTLATPLGGGSGFSDTREPVNSIFSESESSIARSTPVSVRVDRAGNAASR